MRGDKAAAKLARAYDRVMKALKESGLKKLKITVQVSSKANDMYSGLTKSVTITVK